MSSLAGLFVGIHMMLARAIGMPELAIPEPDARAYLQQAQNVLRHYDVQATQKTLDWGAFMAATVGLYGPRLAAGLARRGRRGQPGHAAHPVPPDPPPGTVFRFGKPPGAP